MPRRAFLPPAVCGNCVQSPPLGQTLLHNGFEWLCPACFANYTPGTDTVSKMGYQFVENGKHQVISRRSKAASEIQHSTDHDQEAHWHRCAMSSVQDHGEQLAREAVVVKGEAVTPKSSSWLRDTLADPELAALDSSVSRTNLLLQNDIFALGLDLCNTVGAANSAEKLLCHEIALAHRVAMDQANRASTSRDSVIELKRLQVSTKMMGMAQKGLLALQKIKTGGTQNVVVQHVHIAQGGQAVIGAVQTGGRGGLDNSREE